ncbi:MAG: DNA-binding protein Alba [Candidatus Bathyarchaeia archaeon]|nr:DNA-binding protein Alba [Candidatus Bathyarchaeota archaeon]
MSQENQVLIGKKPLMNYVVASLTLFNHGASEVVLRARGRAISRAVDVAEMLRRVFLKDLVVKSITIGSEEVQRAEGGVANVSIMEITLKKK